MTVEKSTVEEHNEEERFLASLSHLDIVQGIQHFQLTSMLASELLSEYVTLQVGKSFWMGLFCLNQTYWKTYCFSQQLQFVPAPVLYKPN